MNASAAITRDGPRRIDAIIADLGDITNRIRRSIHEADITFRFCEDTIVTLTFAGRAQVRYRAKARHGFNALADELVRRHIRLNDRRMTKCWRARAHILADGFVREQLSELVTYVEVALQPYPSISTRRSVYLSACATERELLADSERSPLPRGPGEPSQGPGALATRAAHVPAMEERQL